MRLIDIDEVIKVAENTFPQEDVRKIMWVLCHTPTAYDIEKVIEELEECQDRYDDIGFAELKNCGHTLDYEFAEGKREAMEEAINIVRKGGVE